MIVKLVTLCRTSLSYSKNLLHFCRFCPQGSSLVFDSSSEASTAWLGLPWTTVMVCWTEFAEGGINIPYNAAGIIIVLSFKVNPTIKWFSQDSRHSMNCLILFSLSPTTESRRVWHRCGRLTFTTMTRIKLLDELLTRRHFFIMRRHEYPIEEINALGEKQSTEWR